MRIKPSEERRGKKKNDQGRLRGKRTISEVCENKNTIDMPKKRNLREGKSSSKRLAWDAQEEEREKKRKSRNRRMLECCSRSWNWLIVV